MIEAEQLLSIVRDLCSYAVPSGAESMVQSRLRKYVETAADEVYVDTLGSLIARHKAAGVHVLLTAHVDEPGLMVVDVTDNGFLRVDAIGPLHPNQFVGRLVQWTNGAVGLVGVAHAAEPDELTFEDLYVDIGASTKDEAATLVTIGTSGVLSDTIFELANGRLSGRGLHNRVGCAIAIAAFQEAAAAGHNVSVAFTAQHVVGARGAKTAAFALQPDYALVIDGALAGDTPNGPRSSVQLGRGPAIRLLDHGIIVPVTMRNLLETAAESANVKIQYDVGDSDLSDAGAIEATAGGILVGGVTYPIRGAGLVNTTVDMADALQTVKLVTSAVAIAAQNVTEHR